MDAPVGCPASVYRLMLQCWNWSPSDRPCFKSIHSLLENLLQQSNIDDEVNLQLEKGKLNRSSRSNSTSGGSNRIGGSTRLSMGQQKSTFDSSPVVDRRLSTSLSYTGNAQPTIEFPPPPPPPRPNRISTNGQLSTFRSSNGSSPLPIPPASIKPKLISHDEEMENDDQPVISPLAEKNLRKANLGGTLPKGQRIEAFLDSMRNVDDLSANDHSTFQDNHGSDDSLDAIPSVSLSAPHTSREGNSTKEPSSELLQQLKQRLKKTTSENLSVNEETSKPTTPILQRPEPKPRKIDDGCQTDVKTTGWGKKKATNLSTATIKSTQSLSSPKSKSPHYFFLNTSL